MGLLINSTEDKKILIEGTEIEVPQVYGRVAFIAMKDGKTMEVQCFIYVNKGAMTQNKFLFTNIGMPAIKIELGEDEIQGLPMALSYMAGYLSSQGYDVEIETES